MANDHYRVDRREPIPRRAQPANVSESSALKRAASFTWRADTTRSTAPFQDCQPAANDAHGSSLTVHSACHGPAINGRHGLQVLTQERDLVGQHLAKHLTAIDLEVVGGIVLMTPRGALSPIRIAKAGSASVSYSATQTRSGIRDASPLLRLVM